MLFQLGVAGEPLAAYVADHRGVYAHLPVVGGTVALQSSGVLVLLVAFRTLEVDGHRIDGVFRVHHLVVSLQVLGVAEGLAAHPARYGGLGDVGFRMLGGALAAPEDFLAFFALEGIVSSDVVLNQLL